MPFPPDGNYVMGRINCLPGNVYINSGMMSAGLMSGVGGGKLMAKYITGDKNAELLLKEADPNRCVS